MPEWFEALPWYKIALSAGIIAAAVTIRILLRISFRKWKKTASARKGGMATAFSVIYSIVRAAILLIALIWVLQIFGVNVTSLVAGLGIAGAIVGLALQDFLKDIFMGMQIVTDDFFKVGDVICYGGNTGVVTTFNLRSTKIRSIDDGSIVTISNRNISEIKKLPHLVLLNVPLSYEEDYRKVHETLTAITQKIAAASGVEKCEYKGTQKFDDSAIIYRIHMYCHPEKKWDAWRTAHKILQEGLDEAGIQIPYQQIDIHNIPAK